MLHWSPILLLGKNYFSLFFFQVFKKFVETLKPSSSWSRSTSYSSFSSSYAASRSELDRKSKWKRKKKHVLDEEVKDWLSVFHSSLAWIWIAIVIFGQEIKHNWILGYVFVVTCLNIVIEICDPQVLGGLVRVSLDRTRTVNGTRGPIDVRIFGIPMTGRRRWGSQEDGWSKELWFWFMDLTVYKYCIAFSRWICFGRMFWRTKGLVNGICFLWPRVQLHKWAFLKALICLMRQPIKENCVGWVRMSLSGYQMFARCF